MNAADDSASFAGGGAQHAKVKLGDPIRVNIIFKGLECCNCLLCVFFLILAKFFVTHLAKCVAILGLKSIHTDFSFPPW